jgi:hypothetical protein
VLKLNKRLPPINQLCLRSPFNFLGEKVWIDPETAVEVRLAAQFSTNFSQLGVQRSSDGSALACWTRPGTVLWIRITFMRIRIRLITMMRIQILIFI